MKAVKILLLLLFSISNSQTEIEIKNGETIEFPLDSPTLYVTYHFIIPESEIYKNAMLIYKFDFEISRTMYMTIHEDGNTKLSFCVDDFMHHELNPINNKTITFVIHTINSGNLAKFTLLDLTKDIKTSLDNLKNIIQQKLVFLYFNNEPFCKFNYDIEEISS